MKPQRSEDRLRACVIALLAATVAYPVAAHPPEPAGVRPGWYMAPMYSFMTFDASRKSSDADGFALGFGYRWDWLAVELRGDFLESLSYTDRFFVPGQNPGDPPEERRVTGQAALSSGHVSLLVEPLQLFESLNSLTYLQHLYATLGAGVVRFDNQGAVRSDEKNFPYEAGLGYLYPFKLFGFGLAARAEAIYRLDPEPNEPSTEPDPQRRYEDMLVHVGLQIPLSPSPSVPAAPPESVAVVPAAYTDTDNDGVIDDRDRCPDTPTGSLVNNKGCVPAASAPAAPVTLETAKAGDTIVLKGVTFEFNSSRLTANAQTILSSVAQTLMERSALKVEIGGHTDSRGSESYNQSLSEQRSDSVRLHLIEQGINLDRLTSVGYGETQPVATNETDEGRERNRRVELKVLESEPQGTNDEPRQEAP